jgi:hypothetical protein
MLHPRGEPDDDDDDDDDDGGDDDHRNDDDDVNKGIVSFRKRRDDMRLY